MPSNAPKLLKWFGGLVIGFIATAISYFDSGNEFDFKAIVVLASGTLFWGFILGVLFNIDYIGIFRQVKSFPTRRTTSEQEVKIMWGIIIMAGLVAIIADGIWFLLFIDYYLSIMPNIILTPLPDILTSILLIFIGVKWYGKEPIIKRFNNVDPLKNKKILLYLYCLTVITCVVFVLFLRWFSLFILFLLTIVYGTILYRKEKRLSQQKSALISSYKYLSEDKKKFEFSGQGLADISEIPDLLQLISLEELILDENEISEIKGLDHLTNLRILSLNFNNIETISGLENLVKLQKLDLRVNKISKLEGLENLTELVQFSLYGNPIFEWTKEEFGGVDTQNYFREPQQLVDYCRLKKRDDQLLQI